jgi:hypothetical protein
VFRIRLRPPFRLLPQRLLSLRPCRLAWPHQKLLHPLRASRKLLRRPYSLRRLRLRNLSLRRLNRRRRPSGLQTRERAGRNPTRDFARSVFAGCL